MFICEYCNSNFNRKIALNKHQKSAKYCLKIQLEISTNYTCDGCGVSLSKNQNLVQHQNNCSEYKIKKLKETYELKIQRKINRKNLKIINQQKIYENRIKKLENKIDRITNRLIDRPTITNNNSTTTNNNLLIQQLEPITDSFLKEQAEFLTIEHIRKGVDGYAQYALEYPLKNRIVCTDKARKKFKHKDGDSNIIDDSGGMIISQKIFTGIKEKNFELIEQEIQNVTETIKRTGNTSKSLLDQFYILTKQGCDSKDLAAGSGHEFKDAFINQIIKRVSRQVVQEAINETINELESENEKQCNSKNSNDSSEKSIECSIDTSSYSSSEPSE